jgi:hypothetical protein
VTTLRYELPPPPPPPPHASEPAEEPEAIISSEREEESYNFLGGRRLLERRSERKTALQEMAAEYSRGALEMPPKKCLIWSSRLFASAWQPQTMLFALTTFTVAQKEGL